MTEDGIGRILGEAGLAAPASPRVCKVGRSSSYDGRISLLCFFDVSRDPAYVVHIPRSPVAASRLRSEFEVLRRLSRELPEELVGTVPQPVLCKEVSRSWVTVHSTVRGQNGASLARPGTERLLLQAACEWLVRLQGCTLQGWLPLGEHPAGQRYSEALSVYARYCADNDGERQAVAQLRAALEALGSLRCPVVASHGDLWLGNVLFADGRLSGILDWEWASFDGDPFFDLSHLILTHALHAAPLGSGDVPWPDWLQSLVEDAATLPIGKEEMTHVFLPLTMVVRAIRDWQRSGPLPMPRGNRYADAFAAYARSEWKA